MLDLFRTYGYELVMPPMLEYLESLLTGTGRDLELQTFKVVDPLSGRLLGLRADITPQVARIDAHLLNTPGLTRLCYAGSVLRTQPDGLNRTRFARGSEPLAAWESARNVVAAPRPAGDGAVPAPVPPAAEVKPAA